MSTSQDNLPNQEEMEAQGEALLDQSVHSGEDSSEDIIVESERILDSPKIGCDTLISLKMTVSKTLSYSVPPKLQPRMKSLKVRYNPLRLR